VTDTEEPLTGGNVSRAVVRVGDTVRRHGRTPLDKKEKRQPNPNGASPWNVRPSQ